MTPRTIDYLPHHLLLDLVPLFISNLTIAWVTCQDWAVLTSWKCDTSFAPLSLGSPTVNPEPTMANSFSEQLLLAARTYPNMCTAFAQFLPGVDYIGLHIQAPEIMMEFAGSVQFGKGRQANFSACSLYLTRISDPKGLLFYNSISGVRKAYYSIHYYQGGPFITARVDFYAVGQNKLKHFARVRPILVTSRILPSY